MALLIFDSYTLYRYSTCLYATADKRTGCPVPLAKMHCLGVDLLVHVHVMCTYVIVAQISRGRLELEYCSTIHAGRRQCGCVLPSNWTSRSVGSCWRPRVSTAYKKCASAWVMSPVCDSQSLVAATLSWQVSSLERAAIRSVQYYSQDPVEASCSKLQKPPCWPRTVINYFLLTKSPCPFAHVYVSYMYLKYKEHCMHAQLTCAGQAQLKKTMAAELKSTIILTA